MQHTNKPLAKDMSHMKDDSDEPFSRLLDLPPELRTMMWDYTLTSTAVKVTDQFKMPPLVQVNRQIRSETRKLVFINNGFQIEIDACGARLFAKFFQLWHRVVNTDKSAKKVSLQIRIGLVGDCHWLNLVRWCRLVSRGKCGSLRVGAAGRGRSMIVEAATGLAANADSWEDIQRGLEVWRSVAGLNDPQWLVDLEVPK